MGHAHHGVALILAIRGLSVPIGRVVPFAFERVLPHVTRVIRNGRVSQFTIKRLGVFYSRVYINTRFTILSCVVVNSLHDPSPVPVSWFRPEKFNFFHALRIPTYKSKPENRLIVVIHKQIVFFSVLYIRSKQRA